MELMIPGGRLWKSASTCGLLYTLAANHLFCFVRKASARQDEAVIGGRSGSDGATCVKAAAFVGS